MTPVLSLVNASIQFGKAPVFSNLTFNVFSQDVISIVGPSGSGKSTLLKILAGLVVPTSGSVCWNGIDVLSLENESRAKALQKMGMLFQKNALFDSMTCFENVAFPLREAGFLSEIEIKTTVEKYLSEVGILPAKDLFPDEISGGMQKRLGIARALSLGPEIVFYDDPTAGLDPITSRKIIDLILTERIRLSGTVIVVTNDMSRAYQLGGRIVVLAGGDFIETGDRASTESHPDPRVQQFIRGLSSGPLSSFR